MPTVAEILKQYGIGSSHSPICKSEKIPFFRLITKERCRTAEQKLNPDDEDDKKFIAGIADHTIQRGFSNACQNCRGDGKGQKFKIFPTARIEILETHHQ